MMTDQVAGYISYSRAVDVQCSSERFAADAIRT